MPAEGKLPPPPKPEPVKVTELPLPPTAPSDDPGSCSRSVNPHRTGCIEGGPEALQSGGYLPDGHAVSASIKFAGAPAAPDRASIYTGTQLIIVKTDGKKFPNGDAWKCITCGVPPANAMGTTAALDYPQPFRDSKRILAGTNIIDCAPFRLVDRRCTPAKTHVYPIRWNVTPDGSGRTGNMRELRLHPDNVHLGWNHILFEPILAQEAYIGRLKFNPSPTTGTPLAPRYELTNVIGLYDETPDLQPWRVDPAHPDQRAVPPALLQALVLARPGEPCPKRGR